MQIHTFFYKKKNESPNYPTGLFLYVHQAHFSPLEPTFFVCSTCMGVRTWTTRASFVLKSALFPPGACDKLHSTKDCKECRCSPAVSCRASALIEVNWTSAWFSSTIKEQVTLIFLHIYTYKYLLTAYGSTYGCNSQLRSCYGSM